MAHPGGVPPLRASTAPADARQRRGGRRLDRERLFEHGGRSYRLEVYGSDQDPGLSVFFTDETNGVQTYGAGRYVPVAADEAGTWVLDFNRAYNPFCAYNPEYICPLPPEHNRLPFAVRAGERNPGPDLASPDLAK